MVYLKKYFRPCFGVTNGIGNKVGKNLLYLIGIVIHEQFPAFSPEIEADTFLLGRGIQCLCQVAQTLDHVSLDVMGFVLAGFQLYKLLDAVGEPFQGTALAVYEAKAFAYAPYLTDDELTTVVTSCAHNCGSGTRKTT